MNKNKIMIFIFIFNVLLLSEMFTNIKGEGFGTSWDEALINAKRNALERSVGIILSSRSFAKNNMLINDNILTKSEGFIKKYNIISESVDTKIHKIIINADISSLIDDIIKDEFAIKFLIKEMGFPKFGVIVINKEGARDSFAENIIIENFMNHYFNVIQISDEDRDSNYVDKIDFIIEGSVDYSSSEIKAYNIKDMYSVHSKIECKIISIPDNTIISSDTFTSKKAHFDIEEAKRQSISLCSEKISKYLIQDSIEKWSKYYNEDLKIINISIANISFEASEKLNNALSYIFNGVESIIAKGFKNGIQTFIINSLIEAEEVDKIIEHEILKLDTKVKLKKVNKDTINLELF